MLYDGMTDEEINEACERCGCSGEPEECDKCYENLRQSAEEL